MFTRILVCSDGSDRSVKAAAVAAELARDQKASLSLLSVSQVPDVDRPFPNAPEIAQSALDAFVKARNLAVIERTLPAIKRVGVSCDILEESGDPADVIIRIADSRAFDLIVVGSRGLPDEKAAHLGSVSYEVIQRAHCTVVVVK